MIGIPMASSARIFQIFYDEKTRASLDPVFEPLDNLSNERPDWFEYWPIRRFLDAVPLDENTYYGFFSPKFQAKTGLTGAAVRDFIAQSDGADVISFSPFPEFGAFHLNVFEHGESCHAGLLDSARTFMSAIGIEAEPASMVMDSRSTVFCNFFVAKPPFWRDWKKTLDACMQNAEAPGTKLHKALVKPTLHDGRFGPQMKIFLMERMVSALLTINPSWKVANFRPFALPVHPGWAGALTYLAALDALKRAYRNSGDPIYIRSFRDLQGVMIQHSRQQRVAVTQAGAFSAPRTPVSSRASPSPTATRPVP